MFNIGDIVTINTENNQCGLLDYLEQIKPETLTGKIVDIRHGLTAPYSVKLGKTSYDFTQNELIYANKDFLMLEQQLKN